MAATGLEVLIADDEESICFGLSRAVKQFGLTPRVVADGVAAVELFRDRCDYMGAAFLDVRMPRLDGVQALVEFRAIAPAVPCCLMTAFHNDREIAERTSRYHIPLLRKPFSLDEFTRLLGAMVGAAPTPMPRNGPARPKIALAFPPRLSLWADVIRGVARYARAGREWVISVHPEDDIAVALAGQPDGVIGMLWGDDAASRLRDWGGPVVDTGPYMSHGQFARVGLADEAVGTAAAEHLLQLGPRHLTVIPQPGIPAYELVAAGFVRRLAVAGIASEVAPVHRFHWATATSAPATEEVVAWVSRLPRPAAVFAVTDAIALRVSEACRTAGLRIPEDIAVLGTMNDPVLCEAADPPLSSVRVAGRRLGFEAARILDTMLAGAAPPPGRVEFPPVGIAVRQSTDETAIADPDLAAALRYLRARLAHRISIHDVVAEVALSRSSLERRFRTVLGHGPLVELVRLRVERAKQLLVETGQPLTHVAAASGFRDPRHLAMTFRRKVGVAPSAYRDRYRG